MVAWAEFALRAGAGAASGWRGATRAARSPQPVDLVPWRPNHSGSIGVLAGMGADGETALLVREPTGTVKNSASTDALRTGARGAPLGPGTTLPPRMYALALGVAPDGRVVLTATSSGSVHVLERPPGGVLGAPQPLTDPANPVSADELAVAFGADGRTVVAWHDGDAGTTGAAVRDGATAFGPPVVIVPAPKMPSLPALGAGLPVVDPLPDLQAAVAPDGRASVAWRDGDARLATVAAGTVVERRRFGGRLRYPRGLSLLALPDGRRALAWTNQDGFAENVPARMHYAVEGAAATPVPATPTITIGAPRERALRPAQSLVLPVRCSAACDLDVTLDADDYQGAEYSLPRAGSINVRLQPPSRAIAPARPGPVEVTVHASAPGARTVKRTNATTPHLRRLPALPLPRIEAVRARRLSGGRIEVRWRTSRTRATRCSSCSARAPGRKRRRGRSRGRPVRPAAPELSRRARGRLGRALAPRRGRRADR